MIRRCIYLTPSTKSLAQEYGSSLSEADRFAALWSMRAPRSLSTARHTIAGGAYPPVKLPHKRRLSSLRILALISIQRRPANENSRVACAG
jgi:hypothetical protein